MRILTDCLYLSRGRLSARVFSAKAGFRPMNLRKRKTFEGKVAEASSNVGNGQEHNETHPASPPPSALPGAAINVQTPSSAEAPLSKERGRRKPPQDIGISSLLLGGGMAAAQAADAIDHLPLTAAGFTRASLEAACDFLSKADPTLAPLIQQHGVPERLLAKGGSNFATLAKTIVFQQLATNAASKIYGRVLIACGCTEALTPAAVLAAPLADLRQAGLSERKASYIVDLAAHFSDGRLSDEQIGQMQEAELEAALCAVRGIGLWTCHMHAIFHLGNPNVLPVGDLGVRKGMQHLYGLKELPSPTAMESVAEAWRPFRSLGSYYMWKVEYPRAANGKAKGKAVKKG